MTDKEAPTLTGRTTRATIILLPEDQKDVAILACARAAHEVNRVYCDVVMGDASQAAWSDAAEWQRASAIEGVRAALAGSTPEEQHQLWCESKMRDGWKYGIRKDSEKKEHPCLVPYAELGEGKRRKDVLYIATARGMALALGGIHLGGK